ncbi:enoyl-CoA hydratase [Pseudooceanicola sp. 216_PA32_1]|uniref:Enoyl-CoA hydratase n=1 Tax=Pseudooceanicola pacificus TaxID=2676438 RepID=A0A844WBJ4_9RHOB|nr:crotonase/enoyl-CoA hydratase family protein [Pseudooceanicola pacificus]MWB78208.1 enoyl-CoA hydratase [Pseudooceanicola pacificus]
MTFSTIAYEIEDGIARICLNRPDKMNAMNNAMRDDILAALDRAIGDDAVRVILFHGAGRMYCAGADLSAGAATFDYDGAGGTGPVRQDGTIDYAHPEVRDGAGLITLKIFDAPKPVIAAVHGAAVGVGSTMLAAMDARFAADDTRFGFVFTRRGIVPEGASTWFLTRIVGLPTALDWCLSGRVFPASEALERGFVRSLHPADEVLDAALDYARDLAAQTAPVSVALTRQMLWKMAGAAHPMEAHKLDSRGVYARGRMADAREGVSSFLEKRDAAFTDRVSADMPDYYPWWDEPPYD